ncbi:uncharacterized protein [Palaemon carinicauda]|uniref:uncharacterized protein n=1 Tax=Palaemon carinicauda TaxID=392227 RepID=UPI0035B69BDB
MMIGPAAFRRLSCLKNHLQFSKRTLRVGASQIHGDAQGVRWLQPAGAGARRMELAHRIGLLHFPVCITVHTAEPLKTDDLRKALVHLYNKIQTLRTCYRYRQGELWVCEMERREIDFQEVSGNNFNEALTALMNCKYTNNENGPLWRVRLMREEESTSEDEKTPGFPHQSTLMISLHHGITDGNASFNICITLLRILEKVIAGGFIDDEEQLGVIAGDEQTNTLKKEIQKHFEKHPGELEDFCQRNLQSEFTSLFQKAFGYPEDPKPTTRYLISNLKATTLKKFLEKCKSATVTFNSGFVLAINTALVELAREAGIAEDAISIRSKHTINLRRYWEKQKNFSFGCHIGRMLQTTDTSPYNKDTFWDHAKKLDLQMREKVKTMYALREEVAKEMKNITEPTLSRDEPVQVDCDYSISNAFIPGDFDLWQDHKHIRGSRILSFIQMELTQNTTFHLIASASGRMNYTISYSTWHITDENALRFMKKVEQIVEDLSN